jgi:hypothetical protein
MVKTALVSLENRVLQVKEALQEYRGSLGSRIIQELLERQDPLGHQS